MGLTIECSLGATGKMCSSCAHLVLIMCSSCAHHVLNLWSSCAHLVHSGAKLSVVKQRRRRRRRSPRRCPSTSPSSCVSTTWNTCMWFIILCSELHSSLCFCLHCSSFTSRFFPLYGHDHTQLVDINCGY